MAEKVVVYTGSKRGFQSLLNERLKEDDETVEFLTLIRAYNAKVRASDIITEDFDFASTEWADNCVVRADDYGSVLSHVISNFATIVSQSYDVGTLYMHNPPKHALESIVSVQEEGSIELISEEYAQIGKSALRKAYADMGKRVLGQEDAKIEIIASLYELSTLSGSKPVVMLFYGPSGVGKTETAKSLSSVMGGTLTRIQFSMMQNNEAANYIFGAEHSKNSLARDLLARESNVILIDEFDKVSPMFYNAFYELFDEGKYVDTNYKVDMANSIFICTSNFPSEAEAQKALGPAMFSRVDACVRFGDLEPEFKVDIIDSYYAEVIEALDDEDRSYIESSPVRKWFRENAQNYNNIRIMKNSLRRAIFGELAKKITSSTDEV